MCHRNARRSAVRRVQEAAAPKTQSRGVSRRRFGVHHVPIEVQSQVGRFCEITCVLRKLELSKFEIRSLKI